MCTDNDCEGGGVDRRAFLAAGGATLAGLPALGGEAGSEDKPRPPTRVLDDPDVRHGKTTFKAGKEAVSGFLARPTREGRYPGVLVIAGNRISEEYIPNTCAALAKAGFVGLAPNLFHPLPENVRPDQASRELKKAYAERALDFMAIFGAAADYLSATEFVRAGRLGVVGFCMGGRLAILFAARDKRVRAVVAFHPGETKPEEVTDLKVPVQFHHGTADRAITHTRTLALAEVLRRQSTPAEVFLYEKLDHGFLAYTRPYYDAEAAKLAWGRSVTFLGKHLRE